jgi:hypothetical protein
MVRGDIIGGLKIALSRGDSLQKAMQSFYNAGYKKEDIEEAARTLNAEGFRPQVVSRTPRVKAKPSTKPEHPGYQPPIKTTPSPVLQRPATTSTIPQRQTVSSYGEKKGIDVITIILIAILIILIGVLIGVFLFKQDLIEFLNKVFG